MKKLLLIAAVALFAGVNTTFAQEGWTKYGQEFKIENVHTMRSLNKEMTGKNELPNIKLEGRISEVCQAEGCWMKLKNSEGEDVFVKFKDHAFLVPKDLSGRAAIVIGKAVRKEVSVDELRHLAEDAGASEAEIAKITSPKQELRIEAVGVMVKN
ncbi:MAG: Branched-chain amino acid aminotransferase [Flavipsychrobacter sp.]|jgi:hypothetical protein|nr:Branched-chain amino acid aminotransferase [Flavipsychrobacter sp.]